MSALKPRGSLLISRLIHACMIVAALPMASAEAPIKAGTVENSVVKVFATVRYPDPYRPWAKQAPSEVTGSGVVIEKKRILSNAHVILYASQVQIQANATVEITASAVNVHAPVATFDGIVNCTTLIASSGVVSPSYTPGAGNIW